MTVNGKHKSAENLQASFKTSALNVLGGQGAPDFQSAAVLEIIRKVHESQPVLDGFIKIYKSHVAYFEKTGSQRLKMVFDDICYAEVEDVDTFLFNMASLLNTFNSFPRQESTKSERKTELISQIGRARKLLDAIKKFDWPELDTSLMLLYFPNYFNERRDSDPMKENIRSLGTVSFSSLLAKYVKELEGGLEGIGAAAQESNQSKERKAQISAFRYITMEIMGLTGKPHPQIVVRLLEELNGVTLGTKFASRYKYKEPY